MVTSYIRLPNMRYLSSLLLALAWMLPAALWAQFDDFEFADDTPTSVTMTFTAPSDTTLAELALESRLHLVEGQWLPDTQAVFMELGNDRFSVTTIRAESDVRTFYRVLRNGEVITATLGEPSDPDAPVILGEGTSSGIPVSFSAPFTGSLTYEVGFSDGAPFPFSIDLTDATQAILPISIGDDPVISGDRYLKVTILPGQVGGGSGSISLTDNDEIWDGVIVPQDGGELTFCMERIRLNGEDRLRLVNPNGTNFMPKGIGPELVAPTFTDSVIDVTLQSAPLPATDAPLGATTFYRIHLNGNVRAGSNGHLFDGAELGDATLERIIGLGDDIEPNDTFANAAPLGNLQPNGSIVRYLEIANNSDQDYFTITSIGATTPTIRIEFTHAEGDLDLVLFDSSGTQLGISNGILDFEQLSTPLTNGETLTIQVFGFNGASNAYRLLIGDGSAPSAPDLSHLSTSRPARFSLIRRPNAVAESDRQAPLFDPAP